MQCHGHYYLAGMTCLTQISGHKFLYTPVFIRPGVGGILYV